MTWVTIVLVCVAGIANALMDSIAFHFHESMFRACNREFWDPEISWRNKYIDGDVSKGRRKWWIIPIPVAFTDAWHLLKSIMLNSMFLAIGVLIGTTFLTVAVWFLVVKSAYGLFFKLFYH